MTPFIDGWRIYLRPLRREDLNKEYLGWLNDPEVNRYLESGIFPCAWDELERFYEQSTGPSQVALAIVDKKTEQHIGNVKLGPINWVHRRATIGILVGNKDFWGKGIGTEATRLMVEYGFFRLNLARIELGVCAKHKAAIRVYEKAGFQIEGQRRSSSFRDGQYEDGLWMGLLREEYV